MAELEEVHAFWQGRDVLILVGPHAGKIGHCLGPCACYYYDILIPGLHEPIVLEEGDFDLPPAPS